MGVILTTYKSWDDPPRRRWLKVAIGNFVYPEWPYLHTTDLYLTSEAGFRNHSFTGKSGFTCFFFTASTPKRNFDPS